MTAQIIDGKALAAKLRARVAEAAQAFKFKTGAAAGLTVVLAGEDPASQIYVRNKGIAAREAGIAGHEIRLPAETSEADLIGWVRRLNDDRSVHGILVQFPVPGHIRQDAILDALDPAKDVDGLTVANAGLLASGRQGLAACTPQGCLLLIKSVQETLTGLNAVIVGRSILVGRPMAQLLLQENCTVTIAHSKSRDLAQICRQADILTAAVGRAHLVRGDWIKPGAIVIDVGMNRLALEDGKAKLTGDVAFEEARQTARAITPVPGGVGPMTIACLLRNTMLAAYRQKGLPAPAGL
jgi:methylenetetrahydrofolate dehydrogenase (NADP+)/methenyltetrahydrofolate cyclohydrolase